MYSEAHKKPNKKLKIVSCSANSTAHPLRNRFLLRLNTIFRQQKARWLFFLCSIYFFNACFLSYYSFVEHQHMDGVYFWFFLCMYRTNNCTRYIWNGCVYVRWKTWKHCKMRLSFGHCVVCLRMSSNHVWKVCSQRKCIYWSGCPSVDGQHFFMCIGYMFVGVFIDLWFIFIYISFDEFRCLCLMLKFKNISQRNLPLECWLNTEVFKIMIF